MICLIQLPSDTQFHHDSDDKRDGHRQQNRKQEGVEPQGQRRTNERPKHIKSAMGQIDKVHDAKDQR